MITLLRGKLWIMCTVDAARKIFRMLLIVISEAPPISEDRTSEKPQKIDADLDAIEGATVADGVIALGAAVL
jgi:hypothetical protein